MNFCGVLSVHDYHPCTTSLYLSLSLSRTLFLSLNRPHRQELLNRLWSAIPLSCLPNAIFERDVVHKKLLQCLLHKFQFNHREQVIARIIYALCAGPPFTPQCSHSHFCVEEEQNNEILSVDLEWEQDPLFANSDSILEQCLSPSTPSKRNGNAHSSSSNAVNREPVEEFMDYILIDEKLDLEWTSVWKYFDDAHFDYFDRDALRKMTTISIIHEAVPPFLKNVQKIRFLNDRSYLNIIKNSLSCASMYCDDANRVLIGHEVESKKSGSASASGGGGEMATNQKVWNSLDFYNVLLSLSTGNLYLDVKRLIKSGINVSPDVVIYGIICSKIECALKEEVLDCVLPTYLSSNDREVQHNQYSILCHSDQYLFCKYIRKYNQYFAKLAEIADIMAGLDIDPLRVLSFYVSVHCKNNSDCSALSFPILLSVCLHSKGVLSTDHVVWFVSNGLRVCGEPFCNALLNLILTDYYDDCGQSDLKRYIAIVFIQLFQYGKALRQTQMTLIKCCLSKFSILDVLYRERHKIDGDHFDRFQALYHLSIKSNADTLQPLHDAFRQNRLSDFDFAILLTIVYRKVVPNVRTLPLEKTDDFMHSLLYDEAFAAYITSRWSHFCWFFNSLKNTKFPIPGVVAPDQYANGTDPFPLMEIIRIYEITIHRVKESRKMKREHHALNINGATLPVPNTSDVAMYPDPRIRPIMDPIDTARAVRDAQNGLSGLKVMPSSMVTSSPPPKLSKSSRSKPDLKSSKTDRKRKGKKSKPSEQSKKLAMERVTELMNDLSKDNREPFTEIAKELKAASSSSMMVERISTTIVHRCSTDYDKQTIYIELLEHLASRELWKRVTNTTYESISCLLNSSTIDEQSSQRMFLRYLGMFIGKLTIGRTKPLLQKKLNLKSLIVSSYEENRLIVVIPFVSKILEATIGNAIFSPPNPWLMSILSLIAELHIYVEKLPVIFEIEQLFSHLNISRETIVATNIIRQRMKLKQHRNFINFKDKTTRIPNLVQYVKISSAVQQRMKSDQFGIVNFKYIIAHGFDRCVCEIVPICVERSIDVACICSRELVLKDTICETSSAAIRKCANQMVSTLSGALTLVICREPIKVSAVQQIKKCLKEAGYLALIASEDQEINTVIANIVDRNLDLVCNMAEKLAADRAQKILEHNLGSLFQSRSAKTHPIPYSKNNVRMQRRVYEDFDTIRHMLRASCREGFTEWNLIFQKLQEKMSKLEGLQLNDVAHQQQQQLLIQDCADLLRNLLSENTQNSDRKMESLNFMLGKINQFETHKHLREATFMILTMVGHKNKEFTKEFTKAWLTQNNSDLNCVLNEVLLLGLLDYNLVVLDDIDKFISSLITSKKAQKSTASAMAIKIGIAIIRSFVLGRKFTLTDFSQIHRALSSKMSENAAIRQLFEKLENIKNMTPQDAHLPRNRYMNYQTRVIALLRRSFNIKGSHHTKAYRDFINNEMTSFLASQPAMQRFLEVSIKIVIGKCSEDLQSGDFEKDLKEVIDAFGKLVVSCIKRIDIDLKQQQQSREKKTDFVMLRTFFDCVCRDVMNRIATKAPTAFNQRPYLRLIVFVLFEISEINFVNDSIHGSILLIFAKFLKEMEPQKCPQFIYSWMQLLSHSKFMPKILKKRNDPNLEDGDQERNEGAETRSPSNEEEKESEGHPGGDYARCRALFRDMLMALLQFVDPFWRSPQSPPSVCLLFQGTLRILLVLLHDFPSFLCEYHFSFCENIPISSFQMRNLVLSAFPKNTQLPDPFQPNLNVQSIDEMDREPKISPDYIMSLLRKDLIDGYLRDALNHPNVPSEIASLLKLKGNRKRPQRCHGFVIQYDLSLINSIILYLASKQATSSSECLDLIYFMALKLDSEGRYHLFNAVCNNLRYPNSHTKFCSTAILFMFKKSNLRIKEQITRILLERLVVHRPHPWGLLITFIQLIKQPDYKFWDEPFTRCSSEIESLFQTVASSCFRVFN